MRELNTLSRWSVALRIFTCCAAFVGCAGDDFSSTAADTGSDTETEPASGCDAVECQVPSCLPQRQVTPEGECCPVCQAPVSCESGARCAVLDCPGDVAEVSPGCCVCEDVSCEGDALPCSDSACVGAEQEAVGAGCCLCGQQLMCPSGEAPCDAILCAGDVLYQQDGCCLCEETEACGADSEACATAACDGELVEVGGGCCRCETSSPVPSDPECAEGAAPCALVDCAGEVVELGDGCCECDLGCDEGDDEYACATIQCAGEVVTKANGCCVCDEPFACGPGEAECGRLSCPGSEVVELENGCCACAQCPEGTINCLNITCAGQVADVGDGCCECQPVPAECGEATQARYQETLEELVSQVPPCEDAQDCTVITLENQCGTDCRYPIVTQSVEYIVVNINAWAATNCKECPASDISCEDAALANEVVLTCNEGRCSLPL